ncbi:MAG: hypothetical protein ACTSW1_11435 [Candidatus Hodarchaeales archaeon]
MKTKSEFTLYRNIYEKLSAEDFKKYFALITDIVRSLTRRYRPGILLGLVELGYKRENFIGGFFVSKTNEIFLNKTALEIMKRESSPEYYKAYLFYLLLHEYIHSTGIEDEYETQQLTRNICLAIFGYKHPVGRVAIFGIGAFFPYQFNYSDPDSSINDIINPEYVLIPHKDSQLTYI